MVVKYLKNAFALLGVFAVVVQPVFAQSIVGDGNVHSPTVIQSANGTDIVQITTPDAQGVSHNTYNNFDIGPGGVILNNSTENYVLTNLGGYIAGNSNVNGSPATVIINETTSSNPSEIEGYLEVAGHEADVIVANPYGIICDGCGFINTDRAILTTGTPTYTNGEFEGFSVDQGTLVIGRRGADATGVSQFDLIARKVEFNGSVHGQRVRVIAGKNDVFFATGETTAKTSNGSVAAEVAIDSTVFGGMYANKITIVSTEQGSGVRAPANMAAGTGGMHIDVNGRLVMGKATSQGQTKLKAKKVIVKNKIRSRQKLTVEAREQLILEADAVIVSDAAAEITADAGVELGDGASIYAAETLDVLSGGAFVLRKNSSVTASGAIDITAQSANLAEQSLFYAGVEDVAGNTWASNLDFSLSQDFVTQSTGVFATGSLSLDAFTVEIDQGGVLPASQFVADADVAVTAETADLGTAQLYAGNALSLDIQNGVTTSKGASISAHSALSLSASEFVLMGTLIQSEDDIEITARGALEGSSVQLVSSRDVRVTTGSIDLNGSKVFANTGAIEFATMGQIQADGTFAAGADLSISTSSSPIILSGDFRAEGDVSVDAGQITSKGDITSEQNLTLTSAGSFSSNGSLTGVDGLSVTSGGVMTLDGSLSSNGVLSVSSDGSVLSRADLIGGTSLSVTSDASITSSGGFLSGGAVSFAAQGTLTQTGFGLATGGADAASVALNGASVTNAGDFTSVGDVTVTAATGAVTQSGDVTAGGDIAVAANAGVAQSGGLVALGNVDVMGSGFTNISGGVVQALGTVGIDVGANGITQSGDVLGNAGVSFATTGALTQTGATGSSDGSVVLSGNTGSLGVTVSAATGVTGTFTGALSVSGVVSSQGAVVLSGSSYTQAGDVIGVGSVSIASLSSDLVITGNVGSDGDVKLSSSGGTTLGGWLASGGVFGQTTTGDLVNTGDVQVAGAIDLKAGGSLNNSGDLSSGVGIRLEAGTTLTNSGGFVTPGAVEMIASGALTQSGSGLGVGTADAVSVSLTGASVTNSGSFETVDGITLGASSGSVTQSGTLFAGSDLSVTATSGYVDLTASSSLTALGALSVTGASVANTGSVTGNGTVRLEVLSGDLNSTGSLSSGGALDVIVAGNLTSTGSLTTNSAATLSAGGDLAQSGTVQIAGALVMTAPGTLTSSATDGAAAGASVGSLELTGGSIDYTGDLIVAGNGTLTATSGAVGQAGSLTTGGDLNLTASGALTQSGEVLSYGALNLGGNSVELAGGTVRGLTGGTVTAGAGGIDLSGSLQVNNALTLTTAGTFVQTSRGLMSAATDDLVVTAATVSLGGANSTGADLVLISSGMFEVVTGSQTYSAGTSTLTATGELTLDGGLTALAGFTGISTGGAVNIGGTVKSNDEIALTSPDALSAASGSTIRSSDGRIDLESGGALSLAGVVSSNGVVTGTGSSVAVPGTVQSGGAVSLTSASGALSVGTPTQAGSVRGTTLTLTSAGSFSSNGSLTGVDGLSVTSGGVMTLDGSLSSNGVLSVSSDGSVLSRADLIGGTSLSVTSDASITSSGGFLSGGAVSFAAQGTLTQTGFGLATGGADAASVALNGASVTNAGDFTSVGDVTMTAATGAVTQSGDVTAGGDIAVAANAWMSSTGDYITNGGLSLTSETTLDQSGSLRVAGAVTMSAGGALTTAATNKTPSGASVASLDVTGSNVTYTGDLIIAGTADFEATSGNLTQSGVITSGGNLSLTASDNLTSSGGFTTNGLATLSSGADLKQSGAVLVGGQLSMAATDVLTISAHNGIANQASVGVLSLEAGSIAYSGDLIVEGASTLETTSGSLTQSGGLVSGGAITLDAAGNLSSTGVFMTNTTASLSSGANLTQSGSVLVSGALTMTATDVLTTTATNGATSGASVGTLALTGGTIAFGGDLIVAGTVTGTSTRDTLAQTGVVRSGGNLYLTAATDLTSSGDFTTNGTATLTSGGDLSASGEILVASALTVYAGDMAIVSATSGGAGGANVGSFSVSGDSVVYDGDLIVAGMVNLEATAGTLTQTSALVSGGNLTLTSTGNMSSTSGLSTNASATLTSGGDLTQSGTVLVAGTLGMTATGALDVEAMGASATNAAVGALSLNGASVKFDGDLIVAGIAELEATSGALLSSGDLTSGGDMSFDAAGALTQSGTAFTYGVLTLDGGSVNISGTTTALERAVVAAGAGGAGVSGSLRVNDGLYITSTDAFDQTATGILSSTTGDLSITAGSLNLAGRTSTGANLSLVSQGKFDVVAGATTYSEGSSNFTSSDEMHLNGTSTALSIFDAATTNNALFVRGNVRSNGAITFNAASSFVSEVTADIFSYQNGIVIKGATNTTNPFAGVTVGGTIYSNSTIDVTGQYLYLEDDITAGTILSADSTNGQITVSGNLTTGLTNLDAGGNISVSNTGDIQGNTILTAGGLIYVDGVINGGAMSVTSEAFSAGDNAVISQTDDQTYALTTGSFINQGSITGGGNILVNTDGSVSNAGTLDAEGQLGLSSDLVGNWTGGTLEGGTVSITADSFINQGTTLSEGAFYITGGVDTDGITLLNTASVNNSGLLEASGNMIVSTAGLTNSGDINGFGDTVSLQGLTRFDNTSGVITSTGNIVLETSALLSLGGAAWGSVIAEDTLSIAGLNGGYLGAVNIASGDEFVTTGALHIATQELNNAGTLASATGDLVVTSAGDITNTGLMYAGGDVLMLRSDADILNDGGSILANNHLVVCGNGTDNCLDDLSADQAGSLTNTNGGVIETFNGDVFLAAQTITNDRVAPTVTTTESAPVQVGYRDTGGGACSGTKQSCHTYRKYHVTTTNTVVEPSIGPAQIVSGGDIALSGSDFANNYSLVSAQGDITLDLVSAVNVGVAVPPSEIHEYEHYVYRYIRNWHSSTKHYDRGLINHQYFTGSGGTQSFGAIEAGGVINGTVTGFVSNGAVSNNDTSLETTGVTDPNVSGDTSNATETLASSFAGDTIETTLTKGAVNADTVASETGGSKNTDAPDANVDGVQITTTGSVTVSSTGGVGNASVDAVDPESLSTGVDLTDSLSSGFEETNELAEDNSLGQTGTDSTAQPDFYLEETLGAAGAAASGFGADIPRTDVIVGLDPNVGTDLTSVVAGIGASIDHDALRPFLTDAPTPQPFDTSAVTNDALFAINPGAPGGYLIETNPNFIDLSIFQGSDYFLDLIGWDPEATQTRLGDALVETYVIRDQLLELTGARLLDGTGSEAEQISGLYDNAHDASQELNLRPGISLTPDQVSALTENIIWLEEALVEGQTVLVPRVYLASNYVIADAATIKAGRIDLNVGSLSNEGTVSSNDALVINAANNIENNGGRVAAEGNLTLDSSSGGVTSTGGRIMGQDVTLVGNSVNIITEVETSGVEVYQSQAFGDTATILAEGDLTITGVSGVQILGTDISAGGNVAISSLGNINVGAVQTTHHIDLHNNYEFIDQEMKTTSITSMGGGLTITSGTYLEDGSVYGANDDDLQGNVILSGLDADISGSINITALDGDINMLGVANTDYTYSYIASGGWLSSYEMESETLDVTWATNTLSGSEINIDASGAVYDQASTLNTLDDALTITSGTGNIHLDSVVNIHAENFYESSSFLGGLLGSTTDESSLQTTAQSIMATSATNIDITSGNDLIIEGGLFTAEGSITTDVAGETTLLSTVDTDFFSGTYNVNNGITITDTTIVDITQTANFVGFDAADVDLDVTNADGEVSNINVTLESSQAAIASQGNSLLSPAEGAESMAMLDFYLPNPTGPPGGVNLGLDPMELAFIELVNAASNDDADGADAAPGGGRTPAFDLSNSYVNIGVPSADDGAEFAFYGDLSIKDNLTVAEMALVQHEYFDEQVSLGIIGQLLIAYATGGIVNSMNLSGVWSAVAKAGISGAFEGIVTGNFDLGDILTSMAMAGVTNYATANFDLASELGLTVEDHGAGWIIEGNLTELPNGGFSWIHGGQLNTYNIFNTIGDQVITAGLNSVVYDTDFGDSFVNGMTNSLISFGMADTQTLIGDWAENNGGEGTAGHILLHGLSGCAFGVALGGECSASALAAMGSAVYAGYVEDAGSLNGLEGQDLQDAMADVQLNADFIAGIGAALGSGGDASVAAIGGEVGSSAFQNNYLTHAEHAQLEAATAACLADPASTQCEIRDALIQRDINRDELLELCVGSNGPICQQAHAHAALTAADWVDKAQNGQSATLSSAGIVQRHWALTQFQKYAQAIDVTSVYGSSEQVLYAVEMAGHDTYLLDLDVFSDVSNAHLDVFFGGDREAIHQILAGPTALGAYAVGSAMWGPSGTRPAALPSKTPTISEVRLPNKGGEATKRGRVNITAANPSASERAAADHMAGLGRNVELRDPVGTRAGGGTSDLLVDGVPYDVYTPTSANPNRIISAIAKKNDQATGIVVDLSNSPVTAEQLGNVLGRVNGAGATNITDIVVIGN